MAVHLYQGMTATRTRVGGRFAPEPALERFTTRIVKDETTGCWLWTAGKTPGGYGLLSIDGTQTYVHRWSYEHYVGPIPQGLQIDHLCRNRACVNPEHLEPVTNRENALRGLGPTAENARKTHCRKGHALSGENLYVRANGQRECKTCRRAALNLRRRLYGRTG